MHESQEVHAIGGRRHCDIAIRRCSGRCHEVPQILKWDRFTIETYWNFHDFGDPLFSETPCFWYLRLFGCVAGKYSEQVWRSSCFSVFPTCHKDNKHQGTSWSIPAIPSTYILTEYYRNPKGIEKTFLTTLEGFHFLSFWGCSICIQHKSHIIRLAMHQQNSYRICWGFTSKPRTSCGRSCPMQANCPRLWNSWRARSRLGVKAQMLGE